MKYKKYKIRYRKERVVLSEILPYEVPLIFSNKNFYNFLLKYKIEINNYFDNSTNIKKSCEKILDMLFIDRTFNNYTIPYEFKIPHKVNEYRKLSIIHPIHQIKVMNFYDTYKQAILYFSSKSKFSIRRPYKVANLFYNKNDFTNTKNIDDELNNSIEIKHHKEKYFKSFFAYKKYSHIYMFYESYEYQKNEKFFKKLYKFDISKCFDSIYTHSITWAIYNKKTIKDNLNKINNTFADEFDKLMQNMNYKETNGVLIGPEFSRIFAELILQKIDKLVLNKLTENNILHKKDYVIFRYVDDYFLFYNKDDVKNLIIQTFNNELQKYKFYLNESKMEEFTKPFVTNITIAKKKIKDLLKEFDFDNNNKHTISSKDMIINFKAILKENEIKYNDILNYTLAIIDKKIDFIKKDINTKDGFKEVVDETDELFSFNENGEFDNIKSIIKNNCLKIKNKLFIHLKEMLKFVFFIYSESDKTSATVKLSLILAKLINFMNHNYFDKYLKNKLYKLIFDEIHHLLKRNKSRKYSHNQNLYLLINLKEIKNYKKLDSNILETIFLSEEMNYFDIVVLLYYIENDSEFKEIKKQIKEKILDKYKDFNNKNTELTLLSMDILACPFLDKDFKVKILENYKINKGIIQNYIIKFSMKQKFWFVKWKNVDILKELEEKKSYEVY
ncbi:antiviral reverse transcriptase Drt3b [Campylobacter jejuni]|uniref:antiviral reverse transcriptase Drt3b n=1 Tax=Campylobacter jejuni TaxID=197 RepID=UPI000F808409|nr:antiviral reverse transcriptase Drt3b [Campylobacter jejuni]RTJ56851.1 reverse transcriptase [Campylobacter jejuni]